MNLRKWKWIGQWYHCTQNDLFDSRLSVEIFYFSLFQNILFDWDFELFGQFSSTKQFWVRKKFDGQPTIPSSISPHLHYMADTLLSLLFFSKKQIYERNICETQFRETRENERILEILASCVFTVVSPWDNESHLF